jgi:hypothetical protein
MRWKKILYAAGIIILAGAGWAFFKGNIKAKPVVARTGSLHLYQNNKAGYEVLIPDNWSNTESTETAKFVSRIDWKATANGTDLGNISEMSITVIATPEAGQPLSTQKEFDLWEKEKDGYTASDSGIVKIKNEEISSQKAVRMQEAAVLENDQADSFFSQTGWFRKNNINYYINMMGNGLLTDTENKNFDKIVNSFRLK